MEDLEAIIKAIKGNKYINEIKDINNMRKLLEREKE